MKYVVILGLMLGVGSLCHAAADNFGNNRIATARSSFTQSADNIVAISSNSSINVNGVSIIVYGVFFGSATGSSWINLFSTAAPVPTSSTMATISGSVAGFYPLGNGGTVFPNGLSYNKTGTAPANILWDYDITRQQ